MAHHAVALGVSTEPSFVAMQLQLLSPTPPAKGGLLTMTFYRSWQHQLQQQPPPQQLRQQMWQHQQQQQQRSRTPRSRRTESVGGARSGGATVIRRRSTNASQWSQPSSCVTLQSCTNRQPSDVMLLVLAREVAVAATATAVHLQHSLKCQLLHRQGRC